MKISTKWFALVCASMLMLGLTSLRAAAPIFSDNFDGETLGLNASGLTNWGIADGSVDVLGTGFNDLLPGHGRYIDLDGSSDDAGKLTSFTQFAAGAYQLKFDLAGSQRGDTNTVKVTFGLLDEDFTLSGDDPFTTFTRDVTLFSASHLVFDHQGGNNLGLLLDNVTLTQKTNGTNGAVIPLPTALPAGLAALGGLSVMWNRLRKGLQ